MTDDPRTDQLSPPESQSLSKAQWLESLPKGRRISRAGAMLMGTLGRKLLPFLATKRPPPGFHLADKPGRPSQASSDPQQIATWWDTHPHLAIRPEESAGPGKPGEVVVDVDVKHFPEDAAERERLMTIVRDLIDKAGGYYAITQSGGYHIFFRAPVGTAYKNRKLNTCKGTIFEHECAWIETRTKSPATLYAPESFPRRSLDELRDLPQDLMRAMMPSKKRQVAVSTTPSRDENVDGVLARVAEAVEGSRNTELYGACMKLRSMRVDLGRIRARIVDAGRACGLEEEEILGTIASATDSELDASIIDQRRDTADPAMVDYIDRRKEFGDDGIPILPSDTELVMGYWPNMRFYASPGANRVDKGGVWLEIVGDRWHSLHVQDIELRVDAMMAARRWDSPLPSREANELVASVLRELHRKCHAGVTTQVDKSNHLLDRTGLPISLETCAPVKPSWEHPLRARLNVTYDPDAKSVVFEKMVSQCLTAGRSEEDAEQVVSYFKRMCGYMLRKKKTRSPIIQNIGVGSNGKTTTLEAILGYLGLDHGITFDSEPFLKSKGIAMDMRNALQPLASPRLFAMIEELPEGRVLNTAPLKTLSGGTKIQTRRMREDPVMENVHILLMFNSNSHLPFDDTGEGWSDRSVYLGWYGKFPKDETMRDRLAADGDGWFQYALAGLREFNEIGEARPECLKKDTAEYAKQVGDPVREFIKDFLVPSQGETLPTKQVRDAFINYAINMGLVAVDSEEEDSVLPSGKPNKARARAAAMAGTAQAFNIKLQNITQKVTTIPGGAAKILRDYTMPDVLGIRPGLPEGSDPHEPFIIPVSETEKMKKAARVVDPSEEEEDDPPHPQADMPTAIARSTAQVMKEEGFDVPDE